MNAIAKNPTRAWRVGIDIGGTFTDVVALSAVTGERRLAKVPTVASEPLKGLVAALEAIGLGWPDVAELVHGTTMVTNALVEGKTSPVALVTTEGFEDVLTIARQNRRALYDLDALPRLPAEVPPERCFGLAERVDALGDVVRAPDDGSLAATATRVEQSGATAVAVSLLHAYAEPAHEKLIGERLRKAFPFVSLSHEVSPEAREYERTLTTVLNASVMPMASTYVDRLATHVPPETRVHLFHSAGGMTSLAAVRERPLTLAMSGPAAGAAAAAGAAREAGIANALAFDMGGTTTDVSLIVDGTVEIASNKRLAGRPVRQPMVAIESIGAGGGSLVKLSAGGLAVGPESAGADPGPAVYGRQGGKATITDANALLGYLDPDHVLGGSIRLDLDAARGVLEPIAKHLDMPLMNTALGIMRVANATMARALRRVTVERGVDIRGCTLIAFGGAGPMHACGLAREVGITRILVPAMSGGFSAFGCIAAEPSYTVQRTVRLKSPLWSPDRFDAMRAEIAAQAMAPLLSADHVATDISTGEIALIRYIGQSDAVEVPYQPGITVEQLGQAFREVHQRLYGYATDEPWEVEALRIRAVVRSAPVVSEAPVTAATGRREIKRMTCWFEGAGVLETPRIDRASLQVDEIVSGPAIIEDASSTVVVDPQAKAWADRFGHLHIELGDAR